LLVMNNLDALGNAFGLDIGQPSLLVSNQNHLTELDQIKCVPDRPEGFLGVETVDAEQGYVGEFEHFFV